jgi:hypothetical protein
VRLLVVLLLAAAAHTQEFARESIAMMPGLAPEQREALHRLHGRLGALEKRMKEAPKEAEKLRAEAEGAWGIAGLDEAQRRRLVAMPRGPLREERYNHGVLLEAPALSEGQRALLLRIVAAADAAQATAVAQREHLLKGLDDTVMKARIQATCDQQQREVERRFWRVAYYVLGPEQMRAVRELFSPRYRNYPELLQQLQTLPELSPSQSVRLRSLFAELESENAADQAEVRRIAVLLRDPQLPQDERAALHQANGAAYQRMEVRNTAHLEAVRGTLTAAQLGALHARPPVLNLGEILQSPLDLVRELRLSPEQAARVQQLEQEIKKARGALGAAEREMGTMMSEIGPESPQMMAVESARQGARGQLAEDFRAAGQTLFAGILTPEQACAWIVAPGLAP